MKLVMMGLLLEFIAGLVLAAAGAPYDICIICGFEPAISNLNSLSPCHPSIAAIHQKVEVHIVTRFIGNNYFNLIDVFVDSYFRIALY